jgi:hypothetical protein
VLWSAPSAEAQTTPNVRVVLDTFTNTVTDPKGSVQATGTVTNTGDVDLSSVNAYVWYTSKPLATRDQIAAAGRTDPNNPAEAKEPTGKRVKEPWDYVDKLTETLKPGQSRPFQLSVPIERLGWTAPGVYSVGVAIGAYARDTGDEHYWNVRTFLPYVPPSAQAKPVQVAFTVPLVASPGLVEGNLVLDESVPRTFAPNGRMRELLELGDTYDLSFLVDPELLAEAEIVARGYRTVGGTGTETSGSADAKEFLTQAKAVFASHDALMLPYADPDVNALARAGLTPQLAQAFTSASRMRKAYNVSGGPIAWPASAYASKKTLEALATSGANQVILSRSALPDLPDDGSTPLASLVTQEGSVSALVTDERLLAGGPPGAQPGLLQRQRLLAETAMLALQSKASTTPRRLVAALPRDFDVDDDTAGLFQIVRSTPWVQQVSATELLKTAPAVYNGAVAYPDSVGAKELNARVMNDLRAYSTTSATYLDLLLTPEQRRAGLYQSFLRGASNAWRRDPDRGSQLISTMEARINAILDDVEVVPPRFVTLSSQTGRFPVTISNTSNTPVVIGLDVRPSNSGFLDVAPIEPVRIAPGRKATVTVNAEATSGGITQVRVGLRTKQGITFGDSEQFTLRVTDYGRVGWLVIGAGVGLLFVAAFVKIVRRIRGATRRREAESTPEERTREHSHL